MTKKINMEVDSCSQCPFCDWDEMGGEYGCAKIIADYWKNHVKDNGYSIELEKGFPDNFIANCFLNTPDGEYHDVNNPSHTKVIIPDWCPLPNK